MSFDDATAVTPTTTGRYRAEIHDGWSIAGNANGGYLLSMAARAMLDTTGRADPVSLTAHYLRPGRPGPVEIAVDVVKDGRSMSVRRATLRSGDTALLELLGTFGDLEQRTDALLLDSAPPALPAQGECVRMLATEGFPPPFMAKVDLRLHPDDAGFLEGDGSGVASMRGWFDLPEGEGRVPRIDTIGVLQAADAFPPTIFNTELPVGWTPTVELTVHVRARPAPGPLRCSFSTRFVTGGFLEVDGEIWDDADVLVAQSRQLALVPRAA